MLTMVADKTGYPTEMLQLSMNMEADLGIDSIKKVEIMGAIQEKYPKIQLDPEELITLQTLEEVAQYLLPQLQSTVVATPTFVEAIEASNLSMQTKNLCRSVHLKALPLPDTLLLNSPANRTCLVTDCGTEMTPTLVEQLQHKGYQVVVLNFAKQWITKRSKLPKSVKTYSLGRLDEQDIAHSLSLIAKEHQICGFIHLHPEFSNTTALKLEKNSVDLLKQVFLFAKHLKGHLQTDTFLRQGFFISVIHLDGKLGLSNPNDNVVIGGLSGLTKSLHQEWNSILCRTVDLSPDLTIRERVAGIIHEIHDPDVRILETGYSKEGRWTLTSSVQAIQPETHLATPDRSSVFLVSGGAKGITAKCILQLASQKKSKFILLGRSILLTEEPNWAKGISDDHLQSSAMDHFKSIGESVTPKAITKVISPILSSREIQSNLALLREYGSEVEYLQIDITDAEKLKKALPPIIQKMGEITGIIHGAGVLADQLVEKKTLADFNRVFDTKVLGLEAMLGVVEPKKLKHLMLFSSVAGFYGNVGQTDYATANEILNKIAFAFKALYPNCLVKSLNWGPWQGGMVRPALQKLLEKRGVHITSIEEGTQIFMDSFHLNPEEVQVVIGNEMKGQTVVNSKELYRHQISRTMSVEQNPFLLDHVIGGEPVLPMVCASSWVVDACEQFYPQYTFFKMQDCKLLKGITFKESHTNPYFIELQEVHKTEQEIQFEVKIWSYLPNQNQVFHYSMTVILVKEVPAPPHFSSFDTTLSDGSLGSSYYEAGTLFHGPTFQGVHQVLNLNENSLTLEVIIPEVPERQQGQFPIGTFNPYAVDIQLQGVLIWAWKYHQSASLPSITRELEFYAPIHAGQKLITTMTIPKHTNIRAVSDAIVHDENGKIYLVVKGAEVTMNKQMNSLFQPHLQYA